MKYRISGLLAALLFPLYFVSAQTADDALLFSGTSVNGTARFQGLGGAQTALGADISSISGNPAGLGFFRKSEWSITPSLSFSNNPSTYLGNTTSDGKGNFNIANLGLVFASPKDDIIGGKWRGGAFGISFNRINSFQNQFAYEGVNNVNSLTDAFVQQANGIPHADFIDDVAPARLQLAYQTYLINPYSDDDNETEYFSSVGADQNGNPFPVRQRETVNYNGARYQWNFSYGGNYDDKLYFGASLGLSRIRYGITNTYKENVLADRNDMILDNFTLTEEVDVAGTGINVSGGIIYKPNDIIRFGASIVSPTYYWQLTDNFRPTITANYEYTENLGEDVDLNQTQSIDNIEPYEYKLTTPMSASAGIAVFAGKSGFISADVTYSTFNSMRFNTENGGDDFSETNQYIRSNYQPAITARIGGEFRKDIFRLRAGFVYQGEAFKERLDNLDRTRLNFTAGAGVRLEDFYIDFAVVHSRYNSGYTPYTYNPAPSVTTKNRITNGIFSFGMFF
ncbi:hypothetical protein GXP67_08670 [Rhodocytophaga rosea]|uniref:Transporter n=1 Tax=Rhodocytophaga rosea TaxID=2704465 RepID=A0A6C0GFK6_9BACT|nr:hypothetical protein [Rhodocytophaga rosea]QHT66727.1 hypothetical protein GXP67_08670 [Rhodocytophaga rosea]